MRQSWASQVMPAVKNLPCQSRRSKTQVWYLGWENPLEEELATHSSILAWKTPWTEEPNRLQGTGSQKVRQDLVTEQQKQQQVVKNLPASIGDARGMDSVPGLGRSPGAGHGNPLQYSCLENPTDRGAWLAIVHWVPKSQTWLKWLSTNAHSDQKNAN